MPTGTLELDGSTGLYQRADATNTKTQLIDAATGNYVGPIDVPAGSVSFAEMQDVTGLSVAGRAGSTTGVMAAITGTDGQVLRVSGTTLGFGTIVAGGIASDAVTTAKILNSNVTLAKLASGITPSHVIKFAGQPTTVGGAAAEAFTISGVAATDLAFVQIVNDGTGNVTVVSAVCTLNTLTVTFSANPGNDTVINYQILRAAA